MRGLEKWNDKDFVNNLYSDTTSNESLFIKAVEAVYDAVNDDDDFVSAFVRRQFNREIKAYQRGKLQEVINANKRKKSESVLPGLHSQSKMLGNRKSVHVQWEMKECTMPDGKSEMVGEYVLSDYSTESTGPSVVTFEPKDHSNDDHKWCWVMFRKSRKLKGTDLDSKYTGYWEEVKSGTTENVPMTPRDKAVPLAHLNRMFDLLQQFYEFSVRTEKEKQRLVQKHPQLAKTPLYVDFVAEKEDKSKEYRIRIDDQLYRLTWWNCNGPAECNAIALKINDNDKELFYMRFQHGVEDLAWYVMSH